MEKPIDPWADMFEVIAPFPKKKVKREKRWWVLEVMDECYECGHKTYRLQWPWRTTYREEVNADLFWGKPAAKHDWQEADPWKG